MQPRIEIAEVDSFHLTLAREALEETVAELSRELSLSLDPDGKDLVLTRAGGKCALRFSPLGDELALAQVVIRHDEAGAFFSRVLARLLIEHDGDLEARLVWNVATRNTRGTHALARYRGGRPVPDDAPRPGNALRGALQAGGEPELFTSGQAQEGAPDGTDADGCEVRRLLERARAEWAEYQRLKTSRRG